MENKVLLMISFAIILCLFLLTPLMAIGGPIFSVGGIEGEIKEIMVEKGDTLWSIAQRFYPKEDDIRKYIFHMKQINQLDGALLVPGQRLKLVLPKDRG